MRLSDILDDFLIFFNLLFVLFYLILDIIHFFLSSELFILVLISTNSNVFIFKEI